MSKLHLLIMALCASLCSVGMYAQQPRVLSLEEIFALADENSKTIQAEDTAVTEAQQEIREAESGRLPDIEMSVSASYLGNGYLLDRNFSNGQSIKMPHFGNNFAIKATNSITKYSLDKTADMNTWDFNATGEFILTTLKNWQFSTDHGYNFYRGYSAGYGEPELIWNAGIAKDIKAFTLSLKCADILGQQKSLHRTTSAEYVEDIRRNVMGRYFLVGLVFNFGRMNASQSSKVERAMWEMAIWI